MDQYLEAEALQTTLQEAQNPLALMARTAGVDIATLKAIQESTAYFDQQRSTLAFLKEQEIGRFQAELEAGRLGFSLTAHRQATEAATMFERELAAQALLAKTEALRVQDMFGVETLAREAMAAGVAAREISLQGLQDHYLRAATEFRHFAVAFEFERPDPIHLADLAWIASHTASSALSEVHAREALIRDQMATVSTAWMATQWPSLSAAAFGQVSFDAAAFLEAQPFTEAGAAAVQSLIGRPLPARVWDETDDDLGARDQARVDAGAEPGLLIIPNSSRLTVGASVGLIVPAPQIPRIAALDGQPTAFSRLADEWLRAAEVKLRFLVVECLRRRFGNAWLSQLPPDLEPEWLSTRAKSLGAGRPEMALFHYAHLSDWEKVISRHWRELFEPVFGRKLFLQAAFDHLRPLRNESGHHRPISDLDEISVVANCRQIVRRIDDYILAQGWPPLGD